LVASAFNPAKEHAQPTNATRKVSVDSVISKLMLGLVLGTSLSVQAGVEYTKGPGSGLITDGNSAVWSDTRTVSDAASWLMVGNLTVRYMISGGSSGDLSGDLHRGGLLLPLPSRSGETTGAVPTPSFVRGDTGFKAVALSDRPAMNSHNYGSNIVPTGTSLPESSGSTAASKFGALAATGDLTLFLSDLTAGGGQSQALNWGIGISAVPEPVNVALATFGGVVLAGIMVRSRPVRRRLLRWRAAIDQWLDAA
jgi:hypothetical protein